MSAVSVLDGVAYSLATASAFAGFGALLTGRERAWRLLTTAGAGVLLVECLLHRAWVAAGVQAVIIALVLGSGWWNRRGRKTGVQG